MNFREDTIAPTNVSTATDEELDDLYEDIFADESEQSDKKEFPPFPGELLLAVETPGRNGKTQIKIGVKPETFEVRGDGMIFSWYDLPDMDPENPGKRKKPSRGTKFGKFVEFVTANIRRPNGDVIRPDDYIRFLPGTRAMWHKKEFTFGEKQLVDEAGNKLKNEDGSPKTETMKSNPTLVPVERLKSKEADSDLSEHSERLVAYFIGKGSAEVQSQANEAFADSAELKSAVMSGRAAKAMVAAGLIEKVNGKYAAA